MVDGVEAAPYPWVRGDLHFTLDGTLLSCVAATPDDRFRDAGDIPAGASDPSAGVRLVLESPKRDKSYSPGRTMQPIKLVLVEEQITAD